MSRSRRPRDRRPAVARMTARGAGHDGRLRRGDAEPGARELAARSDGRLSAQPADSPEAAARQFVSERADLWQLNNQDVGDRRGRVGQLAGPADGAHDSEGRWRRGLSVGHDRSRRARQQGGVRRRAALPVPPAPSRRARRRGPPPPVVPRSRRRGDRRPFGRGGDRQGGVRSDRPSLTRPATSSRPQHATTAAPIGSMRPSGKCRRQPKQRGEEDARRQARARRNPTAPLVRAAGARQGRAVPDGRRPVRARLLHRAVDPRISGRSATWSMRSMRPTCCSART